MERNDIIACLIALLILGLGFLFIPVFMFIALICAFIFFTTLLIIRVINDSKVNRPLKNRQRSLTHTEKKL